MLTNTTRDEHLQWAKSRALEYLPADPQNAAMSFLSDLRKHDETKGHVVQELMVMHMVGGLLDARTCRDLIEGTR